MGEIEAGAVAVEGPSGVVVGACGVVGGAECAEPEASSVVRHADLGHPLAPRPLPHAAIRAEGILRPAFAFHAALARSAQRAAFLLHGFFVRCCERGGDWTRGVFVFMWEIERGRGERRRVVGIHVSRAGERRTR